MINITYAISKLFIIKRNIWLDFDVYFLKSHPIFVKRLTFDKTCRRKIKAQKLCDKYIYKQTHQFCRFLFDRKHTNLKKEFEFISCFSCCQVELHFSSALFFRNWITYNHEKKFTISKRTRCKGWPLAKIADCKVAMR